MREIERKFLVDDVPPGVELGPGERLRQGYLAEEGDVTTRLRIGESGARVTIKAGRGLARTEIELPVTAEQADALWPHTEGRRVAKVRHRVPLDGGLVAELDEYGAALTGLRTVEVEFESEDAARRFVAPSWFGRELTDEPGWTNAELARSGRPEA